MCSLELVCFVVSSLFSASFFKNLCLLTLSSLPLGLVHTAPGHGFDDYLVCKKASISPFCSVDNQGCLIGLDHNMSTSPISFSYPFLISFPTDEIGIPSLAGKDILKEETNQSVVDLLNQNGFVLF